MEIRNENLAGYPREPWLMTAIEFRAYLMITEACDEADIALRGQANEILKAGFGIKVN